MRTAIIKRVTMAKDRFPWNFVRFIKNLVGHQRSEVGITASFTLFSIIATVITGFLGYFFHTTAETIIISLLIASNIYIALVTYIASVWYNQYHQREHRNRVYFEQFDSPWLFAYQKLHVLYSIDPKQIMYSMYAISHCNMFADPDGRTPEEKIEVRKLNVKLWSRMAEIALTEGCKAKIGLILHFDEIAKAREELTTRQKIFSDVARERHIEWNKGHFYFRPRYDRDGNKDYLVVGEHLFKTIRLATGNSRYIYIRGADIAQSYREWMEDSVINYTGSAHKDEADAEAEAIKIFEFNYSLNKSISGRLPRIGPPTP